MGVIPWEKEVNECLHWEAQHVLLRSPLQAHSCVERMQYVLKSPISFNYRRREFIHYFHDSICAYKLDEDGVVDEVGVRVQTIRCPPSAFDEPPTS